MDKFTRLKVSIIGHKNNIVAQLLVLVKRGDSWEIQREGLQKWPTQQVTD